MSAPQRLSEQPHFDEMTGLLYLEEQLDDERAKAVERHAELCGNCRELLRVLKNESVWLRHAIVSGDEAMPASVLGIEPKSAWRQWGWLVGLGVGATGAYSLWTGLVEPWMAQASNIGVTQGNLMTMLFFSGAFWNGWNQVLGGVEFLAFASLAAVAVWALRRFFRRQTRVAVASMMGIAVLIALPSAAHAAETEHGNPNYTLAAGQQVKTDLFVWADHALIDGEVDGDLIAWGREVEVNGHVKGDIIAFTQDLRMNGTVDGNVRVFAQNALLAGQVGKNLMGFVQSVELNEKGSVGGSATVFSRDLQLNGPVTGDLLAFAQTLDLESRVGGDAKLRGNDLRIGATAGMGGKTEFRGPKQPQIDGAAKLASPIEIVMQRPRPETSSWAYYRHQVFRWAAAFVLGMVLFLLAPGFYLDTAAQAQKSGLAMGIGLLFLVGIPVAALIACITIVGLGLGLVTLVAYIVAIYMSQIFVGAWLGDKLMGQSIGTGQALARLAIGLAILRVVRWVPFIGPLSAAVVIVWGLGAYVLALHKRMRQQAAVA